MKLYFKQRLLSWLDSYDIYDEEGRTVYVVKGELAFGHRLRIFDSNGEEVGRIQQSVFTLLPKFELYMGDQLIGTIQKQWSFLRPRYEIDCCDWHVEGSFTEWSYIIYSLKEEIVATVSKEVFHLTDTYTLDINHPEDALYVVMLVLSVDAEKCSRNSG